MNDLMIFEGNQVEIILNEKEKPLFEIYSTGMALGYINKRKNSVGKEYITPYKSRIDKIIKNASIKKYIIGGKKFVDIEGLKNFISLCHTENKMEFINWLKQKGYINHNDVFLSTRKEIVFFDELEESLKHFNLKGIRQYHVLSYRVDYYIPSLNIAIEYDENDHSGYSYEAHEGRQKEIEQLLGCRFIRVTDNFNIGYNIGYVIKNIFSL